MPHKFKAGDQVYVDYDDSCGPATVPYCRPLGGYVVQFYDKSMGWSLISKWACGAKSKFNKTGKGWNVEEGVSYIRALERTLQDQVKDLLLYDIPLDKHKKAAKKRPTNPARTVSSGVVK